MGGEELGSKGSPLRRVGVAGRLSPGGASGTAQAADGGELRTDDVHARQLNGPPGSLGCRRDPRGHGRGGHRGKPLPQDRGEMVRQQREGFTRGGMELKALDAQQEVQPALVRKRGGREPSPQGGIACSGTTGVVPVPAGAGRATERLNMAGAPQDDEAAVERPIGERAEPGELAADAREHLRMQAARGRREEDQQEVVAPPEGRRTRLRTPAGRRPASRNGAATAGRVVEPGG